MKICPLNIFAKKRKARREKREVPFKNFVETVDLLAYASRKGERNLQLSGDPQYQPVCLKPYQGYDQRVGWQIIVEWYWMVALAKLNVIPRDTAALLTKDLLWRLLKEITTTDVTETERKPEVGHDILALMIHMKLILPQALHRYLHLGLTSYDTIMTAYALCYRETFQRVLFPLAQENDVAWRGLIAKYASTRQIGRTHLQNAIPKTIGCWLAKIHYRHNECFREADRLAHLVPGKASGAIGTSAAIRDVIGKKIPLEAELLRMLGLLSEPSTQVPPPEALLRLFNELGNCANVFAQLGRDCAILGATEIGEVYMGGSTSSTMSHKRDNPIIAENMDGMAVSVYCEIEKPRLVLPVTKLDRDLCQSNVMRGFGAIFTFLTQMMLTCRRGLSKFKVIEEACMSNLRRTPVCTSELLHLYMQLHGMDDAHGFFNKEVVPEASKQGVTVDKILMQSEAGRTLLAGVPEEILRTVADPTLYIGDAEEFARRECKNIL